MTIVRATISDGAIRKSELSELKKFGFNVIESDVNTDGERVYSFNTNEGVEIDADRVYVNSSSELIAPAAELFDKFPNVKFNMKPINLDYVPKGNTHIDVSSINKMMNSIQEKFDGILDRFNQNVEFNERCEVHVPNMPLMMVNQVAYCTDYCTEQLQDRLIEGWRILAICPQSDQRRPDYIIGRHVNDTKDVDSIHFS